MDPARTLVTLVITFEEFKIIRETLDNRFNGTVLEWSEARHAAIGKLLEGMK